MNRRRLTHPRAPADLVWFAIPLVSRRRAPDWPRVEQDLAVTLASLMAQTDPRWTAVICGQDRPSGLPDDPRIRFHRVDIADRFNDQLQKGRAMVAEFVRARRGTVGYYFKLDADDILHPGVVAHVLSDDNGQGYVLDSGYALDVGHLGATGHVRLARLGPRSPARTEFFRHCGSCAAFWVDLTQGADFAWLLNTRGNHAVIDVNMADFGFQLADVPFPAGIYVLNHGNNMRQRKGKLDGKLALFDRLGEPDPAAAIRAFGLDRLYGLTPPAIPPASGPR
ncbi:MAG: glycosyltransferase family 2 protein [Rhodobacteraceae bacterium]|nr:glycosyltransferase family 2 protein [Paracoccaceae bacterium]